MSVEGKKLKSPTKEANEDIKAEIVGYIEEEEILSHLNFNEEELKIEL